MLHPDHTVVAGGRHLCFCPGPGEAHPAAFFPPHPTIYPSQTSNSILLFFFLENLKSWPHESGLNAIFSERQKLPGDGGFKVVI